MTNQPSDWMSAAEAARFLGVEKRTLYAYVSRGLVKSVAGTGRARLYARSDLERTKAKSAARSGHGAVAAGALRWGEPVLESAITEIRADGPHYRGHSAVELAEYGTSFERVCALLWRGNLDAELPPPLVLARKPQSLRTEHATYVDRMIARTAALSLIDADRYLSQEEIELGRARMLLGELSRALSPRDVATGSSIAETVLLALGARPTRKLQAAVDLALVLSADHELNVSSFAARVVASAQADLYATLLAALAAMGGPLHGGMCDRIEALLREVDLDGAKQTLRARARRGEALPGLGHPLYPNGDPRAIPLLRLAKSLGERSQSVFLLVDRARELGHAAPTLDLGLVALSRALDLPAGSGTALFAVGRVAGWVAHAREQRAAGFLLRPRARYTGPNAAIA
jgi:citrate synthase